MLEAVETQKPDQKVKVTLKGGQVFNDVNVTANSQGVYSGTVAGITPGTYEVIIKGTNRLAKNFGSVTFTADQTVSKNWTSTPLLAGDLNGDGKVGTVDIGMLIQDYTPNTPANSPADFNLDGTVSTVDIGIMLDNYYKTDEQ